MPNLGEEMYDAHSMPTIAPTYPDGAIRYNADALVASFEIDKDVYERVIPAPLEPLDDPVCQLMSMDFYRTSGYGPYKELIVGVPTMHEGNIVAYCPFLFATGSVGTAAGREIFGAPKVDCEATFEEHGKEVQRVYSKNDIDVATLSFIPDGEVKSADYDDLPLENDSEMACWKRIPSAVPGKPPAVDRLITLSLTELEIEWAHEGDVEVDFSKSADAPLHIFEPTSEPTGHRVSFSWLGGGHEDAVLHTYKEFNP